MPTTIDVFSNTFKTNGLWSRLLDMHGGNVDQVYAWWTNPCPHAPFNLRAPIDLMNDSEWILVKNFIEARSQNSGAANDYGPQEWYHSDQDHEGNLLVNGRLPELRKAYHRYRVFGGWKNHTKKRWRASVKSGGFDINTIV